MSPMQQMFLGLGGPSAVEYNASNSTNIVLATVFGTDWAADKEKIYNVPSGVTIGGTGSAAALVVSSGMSGTLVINVSGTVIGTAGAGGNGGAGGYGGTPSNSGSAGGAGRDAISVASSGVTINNLSGGQISGGGGGGGGGGQGGRSGAFIFVYAGGAGGNGGSGAGYNQSATVGGGGSAGAHPNAGSGGSGGNGGSLGNSGNSGSQGNGPAGYHSFNGTPGSGGGGGAAGKAISNAGASWTNGTTSGTYHGSYT